MRDLIIDNAIKQYGGGDISYAVAALQIAKKEKLITKDMPPKKIMSILKKNDLAPFYGDHLINEALIKRIL
jgi:hypothetical protein